MSNKFSRHLLRKSINATFPGSPVYWENRYHSNGNSGKGSYGKNAEYKAGILNVFVINNQIPKVIEWGCGDGNQLKYFSFPNYIGLDVSPTSIQKCKSIFKNDNSKQFFVYPKGKDETDSEDFKADLSISLDVIFHLVEDEIFEKYMKNLFIASTSFVLIYAWDVDGVIKFHVRQRNFSKWILENIPSFQLIKRIPGDTINNYCDFFIYKKAN